MSQSQIRGCLLALNSGITLGQLFHADRLNKHEISSLVMLLQAQLLRNMIDSSISHKDGIWVPTEPRFEHI